MKNVNAKALPPGGILLVALVGCSSASDIDPVPDAPPLQVYGQQASDQSQNRSPLTASCTGLCPPGYTCDISGSCSGGTPSSLVLDVKARALRVSGQVRLNGAIPTQTPECSPTGSYYDTKAEVTFTEIDQGNTYVMDSRCKDTGWSLSGVIYPGNYRVSVNGGTKGQSNLPSQEAVVQPMLAVTSDLTGQIWDVKTVRVSGQVRLNGATPTLTDCSATSNSWDVKSTVTFTEVSRGSSFSFDSHCKDSGFGFSGAVYPGTYRVSVNGGTHLHSGLPAPDVVVQPMLVVTGDLTGQVLDVKTVRVGGQVKLNGATPIPSASCSAAMNPLDTKLEVTFTEINSGAVFSLDTHCKDSGFGFSGVVYPGTYRVTVNGGTHAWSNLPAPSAMVEPTLAVTSDLTGQVLDVRTVRVSGQLRYNGATPVPSTDCSATMNPLSTKAEVIFTELNSGAVFGLYLSCKDGFGFSGVLYPGTYRVAVSGINSHSNLPNESFTAATMLVVASDLSGQVYDVPKIARLSGKITLNGASAPERCVAGFNLPKASVTFLDPTHHYAFHTDSLCADPTYNVTTDVFPGTYRVVANGGLYGWSDLPYYDYVAMPMLTVTGNASGQVYDVKTVAVSGRITLNGSPPTRAPSCATSTNYKAEVIFTDVDNGNVFHVTSSCPSTDFTFRGAVYAGTYRVTVSNGYPSGYGGLSSLPAVDYLVIPRLTIP